MRRSQLRRTPLRSKLKTTGPAPDVVEAVYERSAWSCERCGCAVGPKRGADHHIHHRRPRAMGGTDRPDTNWPSNLLLLCPSCHWQIEERRGDAMDCGWLVSQLCDPAATPVFLSGDRIRYLTADGRYSIHPPKEKADA